MINNTNRLKTFLETKKGILIVILSIIIINTGFYNFSNYNSFPSSQRRGDASGFSFSYAKQFVYFHYYTGDFPLATLNENLQFSEEDARKEISENGHSLIMEYKHWSRLGENARIWAFLPNSIIKGSPENPSIKLFNALVLYPPDHPILSNFNIPLIFVKTNFDEAKRKNVCPSECLGI